MVRLKYRFIYDDDGNPLPEGSKVMVNDKFVGIIHFDDDGEIKITSEGIYMEDLETSRLYRTIGLENWKIQNWNAEGQMSLKTHSGHFGFFATQILRP